MIILKQGVNVRGLHIKIWDAIYLADEVYSAFGVDAVVTAGVDGEHGYASLHFVGCGVDLRTRTLSESNITKVYGIMKERLGPAYDVVLHKTHLHIDQDKNKTI